MKFEALTDDHAKFAYVAYKAGAFERAFEDDLEPMDFALKWSATASRLLETGTEIIVARAETAKGDRPVGFFTIDANYEMAWPHVYWLPWASDRNKLEVTAKFLQELKKDVMALIIADPQFVKWFRHLARYGLLRQIGTLRHCQLEGKALFQTVTS